MTGQAPDREARDSLSLLSLELLDIWAGRVRAAGYPPVKWRAYLNLSESCSRLLGKRDRVQTAAMRLNSFGLSSAHLDQLQKDLVFELESWFQGLYSTLSHMANVVHRNREIFGTVNHRSNEKFLTDAKGLFSSVSEQLDVLEEARRHRTFLDHPASSQVSDWMTTDSDPARLTTVVFFGDAGSTGSIPVGATRNSAGAPMAGDWIKPTPNHLLVESALKLVMDELEDALERSGPLLLKLNRSSSAL